MSIDSLKQNIVPGTKLLVTARFMLMQKADVLHGETSWYAVTPPVYCYDNPMQLEIMAIALAKIAFLERIKNLAVNDLFFKEILESSDSVVTSAVIIEEKTTVVSNTVEYSKTI